MPQKMFTRLFENNKKTISLTSLILPFLKLLIVNLTFCILQSNIGHKLRKLSLLKVMAVGSSSLLKSESQMPLLFLHKSEIISHTGLTLSLFLLIQNLTHRNLKLVVNEPSNKVSKHGTGLIQQGTKRS